MIDSNFCADTPLNVPTHIAIVMDGNGRWAQQHSLPRLHGHSAGVKALKDCVKSCLSLGVRYLTAFAFSSENWRRPDDEVQGIMRLFIEAIRSEAKELQEQNIQLCFIGNRALLAPDVLQAMEETESFVLDQPRLTLLIAINYGGRWDIMQAAQVLHDKGLPFTEENLQENLITFLQAPDPDLIIRTGGEMRISNFLLWQAAYAELYFTPILWPDFKKEDLVTAIESYCRRERRFGALPRNK
ncbi:MAG: polyprenyl diphosphate synthase [Saezia sp.]